MELGSINTRCQGVNLLHGAIHENNGVVWSDGKGIYLAPISVHEGQLENQQPTKLGEFDRGVKSVHWSGDISDGFCYMCVVHDKNISIWKVEGHPPKLAFKQVRKVNIQPVPQGCLWNPGRDILCVLCPHQASLYYSHIQNKGSHVLLQLDKEKIRCGCWLLAGTKLVICAGTNLMVYCWPDVDSSVIQYSNISWTISGLAGAVSSIVPLSSDEVVCAAELPLESLCKQKDSFVLPDLLNTQATLERSHLTDSDIIRPHQNTPSITDVLLNLPKDPQNDLEDSSCLVVVCIHDNTDPEKVSLSKVKGILTPNILLYEKTSKLIVVGSNTQTLLQLFTREEDTLKKTSEICLDKDERPTGISCLPVSRSLGEGQTGVILLVGKKEPSDSAFLSSTNSVKMKSVLKLLTVKSGKGREHRPPLVHTKSLPLSRNNGNSSKQNGTLSVFKASSHDDLDTDQGYHGNGGQAYLGNDFASLQTSQAMSCVNLSNNEPVVNNHTANLIKREQAIMKSKSVENVNYKSDKQVLEEPVPPRRPIRKKRSARGRNDLIEKVTSQGNKESVGKMPMDYSSSSPDMSPRQTGSHGHVMTQPILEREEKQSEVSSKLHPERPKLNGVLAVQGAKEIKELNGNKENIDIVDQKEKLNTRNSSGVSTGSKHSSHSKFESSNEESPRDMPLLIRPNVVSNKGKIEEIGTDNNEKELEVERVEFDSQKRNFQKPNLHGSCFEDNVNDKVHSYVKQTLKSDEKNVYSERVDNSQLLEQKGTKELTITEEEKCSAPNSRSLENLDDIDRLLKQQTENINRLQRQVSDLDRRVSESSCVLPSRYQTHHNPELVNVSFRCKDGSEITKKFLLDNGRLQLEPIKQAFCLDTVEIFLDNEPCVTGSNIDGYVPMRFEPGSSLYITGRPSLTML